MSIAMNSPWQHDIIYAVKSVTCVQQLVNFRVIIFNANVYYIKGRKNKGYS